MPVAADYVSQGGLSFTTALLPWQSSCGFHNMNNKAAHSLSSCVKGLCPNFFHGLYLSVCYLQEARDQFFIIHTLLLTEPWEF